MSPKRKTPLHPAAKPDMRRQLLATARKLGEQAGLFALEHTEAGDSTFGARAYEFIVSYVREHGPIPGEAVTLAARCAGITPANDDRAFGPIYQRALASNDIKVVDSTHRVRGHGSAGGKVYAAGDWGGA